HIEPHRIADFDAEPLVDALLDGHLRLWRGPGPERAPDDTLVRFEMIPVRDRVLARQRSTRSDRLISVEVRLAPGDADDAGAQDGDQLRPRAAVARVRQKRPDA